MMMMMSVIVVVIVFTVLVFLEVKKNLKLLDGVRKEFWEMSRPRYLQGFQIKMSNFQKSGTVDTRKAVCEGSEVVQPSQ